MRIPRRVPIRASTPIASTPIASTPIASIPIASILMLIAVSLGCRAARAPEQTSAVSTMTTVPDPGLISLGANDVLTLAVFGQPEMSSPLNEGLRVSTEGYLSVPLAGPVRVAGLTVEEAQQAVTEALKRYLKQPAVSLSVMEHASKRFYLFGEVEQPGPQVMDRPLTALEALSMGKGLTEGANRKRVALIRKHGDGVEVHFFSAATPGVDGLVQVNPEDLVFVMQTGSGRFRDKALPILQGLGFSINQIASLILIADRD